MQPPRLFPKIKHYGNRNNYLQTEFYYMTNDNKTAIVNAIWDNPQTAFGCPFKQSGRYLENLRGGEYDERGKIRLTLTANGGNIMVFYNGGSRKEKSDVFTYLETYVLKTAGFRETLTELGRLYGIDLHLTDSDKQALTRAALAREVAPALIDALRRNPQGETARYITETRGLKIDGVHFGELTAQSIEDVKTSLKNRRYKYAYDDLRALGISQERANSGYNCVIPVYRNGQVQGFIFRNIRPDVAKGDRYKYSAGEGLTTCGYCDTLTPETAAVLVEGQIDAIRLIQAGIPNVIATGGAKINDNIARLLHSRRINEIYYIPDTEYNDQGQRKTSIISDAIQALQAAKVDGETVVNSLYIAEIPTPEGVNLNGYKIDADTYGKEKGNDELAEFIEFAPVLWYNWALDNLITWANEQQQAKGNVNIAAFQSRFDKIYSTCSNPYDQQGIKREIVGKHREIFEAFNITPAALNTRDEWKRADRYAEAVKQAAADLNKAVQEQATPETVGAIIARLSDAQADNVREDWRKQLGESFDDELKAIREQPETVATKWELGNINPNGGFIHYEKIEFYPADITVFCAPTSHGKTMILFQSALDLVQSTDKTYLYVSCEENKRQLVERALNVYTDIESTKDGKTEQGEYCFIQGTRKKTIKNVIRDAAPLACYGGFMGVSEHYNAVSKKVREYINRYGQQVRPRLKFVHSDATAESICNNITRTVEEYRNTGVEVGAVFVDYMQLLTTESRNFSRHDELKDICKALRDTAAALELPVIIAAQLNRTVLNTQQGGGLDGITVANIGEGADIERIAHDIYLIWQTDKTNLQQYYTAKTPKGGDGKAVKGAEPAPAFDSSKIGIRSNRIFTKRSLTSTERELKTGYLYVEQLKARDGKTGGWGLFPFDGERGKIDPIDTNKMAE